MTRTGFLALVVAAVLAVALVLASVARRPAVRSADVVGTSVFPGLTHRLNGLNSVVITSKDGTVTLDVNGKAWTVRERDGYPADGGKVAAADFAKTANLATGTRLG